MSSSRVCVVPGSFDPITLGHLDIISRAARIFDQVIVAVGVNSQKRTLFSLEERVDLIARSCAHMPNISVRPFAGLLTDYARSVGAQVIVRGLRSAADFDYEYQIASVYRHLAPELEPLYLVADAKVSYISSSIVREIALADGDLSGTVPDAIVGIVRAKIIAQKASRTGGST